MSTHYSVMPPAKIGTIQTVVTELSTSCCSLELLARLDHTDTSDTLPSVVTL